MTGAESTSAALARVTAELDALKAGSDLTFRQAQADVWQNKLAKGFNTTDVPYEFCLLTAEVGEAIDAWRHGDGVAAELADVALFAMGVAQMCGIDLGQAVTEKLDVNRGRQYVRNAVSGVLVKAEAAS